MITVGDLGQLLDAVSPITLKGAVADRDGFWHHPDWTDIICKYGPAKVKGETQRLLRLWLWIEKNEQGHDKCLVVLTANVATPQECDYFGWKPKKE